MTVPSTSIKAGPFDGNDVASAFSFTFPCFAAAELRVVEAVVATGVETDLVLDSGYSVTLNTDQEVSPGGTVTYKVAGVTTPLPSTKTLVVISDVGNTQPTSLPNGGAWRPKVVERALDRLTLQVKQHAETLTRVFKVDVTSDSDVDTLLSSVNTKAAEAVAAAASAGASATAADASADLAAALVTGLTATNIAALKALPKTGPGRAFVLGYYVSGDGGGGSYYYDAADTTSADNGGTIIVATDGGRWKLLHAGAVSIKQFGAKCDGATDDSSAINTAISADGIYIVEVHPGVTAVSSTINLVRGASLIGYGSTALFDESDNEPVSTIKWTGSVGGAVLDAGNRWQGRLENLYFDLNFSAVDGLNLGAPQNSIFQNLVIARQTSTGTGYGVRLTTDGQTYQSGGQYPSGSQNKFDTVIVRDMQSGGVLIDGTSPSGGLTLLTFINCRIYGGTAGNALTVNEYCDDIMFFGGSIDAGSGSEGIVLNYSSGASDVYAINFFGTAIENQGSGSIGIDARNNMFPCIFTNCYLPSQGIQYTTSVGSTTCTGSISGTTLTVTAANGLIGPGMPISGSGVTSGTRIVGQLSQSGFNITGSISGTTLTVSSTTGTVKVWDFLSGGGISGTCVVLKQLTGTAGGAGTYQVSSSQTASGTISATKSGDIGTYLVDRSQTASSTTITVTQSGKLRFSGPCPNLSLAQVVPTVSSSPFYWYNDTAVPHEVVFWGATFTNITRYRQGAANGIGTGNSVYTLVINPGEGISITYTGGPPVVQCVPLP